jgi:hypothetical protein
MPDEQTYVFRHAAAAPAAQLAQNWRRPPSRRARARRRLVRLAWPRLARALDELVDGVESQIGPL